MTTIHAATERPEDRRRGPSQGGLARRPRHPREHHPVLDRRRQGVGGHCLELNKKLTGGFRVPTSDVSVVDLTVTPTRTPRRGHLRGDEGASEGGPLKGVLGYNDRAKVVATDFSTTTTSFDAVAGIALVMEGRPSSRSWPGTTTSGATPAACCASSSHVAK